MLEYKDKLEAKTYGPESKLSQLQHRHLNMQTPTQQKQQLIYMMHAHLCTNMKWIKSIVKITWQANWGVKFCLNNS